MILATSVKKETITDYCQRLAKQMASLDELPLECRGQKPLLLRSRPTDPFAGMHAAAGAEARRAVRQKRENHAQLQRRMTSLGRR